MSVSERGREEGEDSCVVWLILLFLQMLGVLADLKVSEGAVSISAPSSATASTTTHSIAATGSSVFHQRPQSEQGLAMEHRGQEGKEEEVHTWGTTVSDVSKSMQIRNAGMAFDN